MLLFKCYIINLFRLYFYLLYVKKVVEVKTNEIVEENNICDHIDQDLTDIDSKIVASNDIPNLALTNHHPLNRPRTRVSWAAPPPIAQNNATQLPFKIDESENSNSSSPLSTESPTSHIL
jgi:hypothetical protein